MISEVEEATRNRGESAKALFHEAFAMFREAVREDRGSRANELQKALLDAHYSACDDVTNLSLRLSKTVQLCDSCNRVI